MRNKNLYIGLLVFLCTGLCSCGNFFEETSQNLSYVSGVSDLDELLVGEVYLAGKTSDAGFSIDDTNLNRIMAQTRFYFPWIHLMDDDIVEFAQGVESSGTRGQVRSQAASAHRWQPNPFWNAENVAYPDENWNRFYKRIAVANSVLFQLEELRGDEEDQDLCNRVEGEAHFLRAYYMFWLVNLYAYPYSKESASEDRGIPLKISSVVEDRYFSRASVQAVYDQIVIDLKQAVTCLKGMEQSSRIKGNYAAAHLLLSRVYLYMENYEGVIAHADSVINGEKYTLLDLNQHLPGASFTYEASPETVFSNGGYIMAQIHTDDTVRNQLVPTSNSYTSSPDLLGAYDSKDLRLDVFFLSPHFSKVSKRCLKLRDKLGRISDYMLLRLPEAYLNKAEAEAVLGRDGEAKATLNVLRARRFAAGDMPAITETGKALVDFVRDERRRELCFEGHRWFDLRRYAVNSKFPFTKEIRHVAMEYVSTSATSGYYVSAGEYVLKAYPEDRAAYVFPIPAEDILFNKGEMKQNDPRPEREMIKY